MCLAFVRTGQPGGSATPLMKGVTSGELRELLMTIAIFPEQVQYGQKQLLLRQNRRLPFAHWLVEAGPKFRQVVSALSIRSS